MQFTSTIKIEDGTERLGMAIEEILVVDKGIIVAQLGDGLMGVTVSKAP